MKYLLLRTTPGLNDKLCEINECLEYAVKYNRMIIVENNNLLLNDTGFGTEITEFLCLTHPNIIISKKSNEILDEVKRNNLTILYDGTLDRDYSEDVIHFWRVIGGSGSFNIVKYINFHDKIKQTFKIRYNSIPKPYISIHIRHTDIGTNIEDFLNKNNELIKNKTIFLASDNISIIKMFKERYNNIYSFSYLVEVEKGMGLHHVERKDEEQIQYNIDTIVDLLLLANGDEYIYSCGSGFSKLVEYMFQNKHMNNISYKNLID
jgi:hypothetical protein